MLLHLLVVSCKPVIDKNASHVHSKATVAPKCRRNHLLLLHVEALHLNQILHVLCARIVSVTSLVLALELLLSWHDRLHSLLHLILHVVEDAVEVDRIELDWHLNGRVLLEMNQGLLPLFGVQHACGPLDALTFLHRDLFSVEDHQLD